MEVRQRVRGVSIQHGWSLVKVGNVPDRPGVASQIFTQVANAGVPIGLILQNSSAEHVTDVSFTVKAKDYAAALESLRSVEKAVGADKIETAQGLAQVEIVGTGILTDPSYVGRIFQTLADAGVNILAIGTSEIRITILVQERAAETAQKALNRAFRVDEPTPA